MFSLTLLRGTMDLLVSPLRCRYGVHLSKEQVTQLVAPHPDTLELVHSWLENHDIPPSSISTSHGGNWLTVSSVPVTQANKLLCASYQLYRRTGTNDTTILRTIGYALPAVLHPHVQTVVPTTYFASARTPSQTSRRRSVGATADMVSREPATAHDNDEITPSKLRLLYRTSAYVPAATNQNALGLVGFMNDSPSPTDLTTFMTNFRTDGVGATYTVTYINDGVYNPSDPHFDANLNMQYAQAMAYPTRHILYSVGGAQVWDDDSDQPARGDIYLEWLNSTIIQPNAPQTIIGWYGDPEDEVPREYAAPLCNLFNTLGARGVSVIFPSGDDGVGEGDCVADDGSGKVQFVPEFPASCMCSVLFLSFKAHQVTHRFRRSLCH
jgi:tripeptidyl-peptidase-1